MPPLLQPLADGDAGGGDPRAVLEPMMGFVSDGQADPRRLHDRDTRLGTSTQALKQDRNDIPWPKVDPGAHAWQSGRTVQLTPREAPVRGRRGPPPIR